MARSSNQKRKILYLMKIFEERTDEEHALSAAELIKCLEEYQVTAERKSIYRDIEDLQMFGMDIIKSKEKGGYYLAGRSFELPELKLLVDAVQASRFITYRKSEELIRKLESLTSCYNARALQRQVVVRDRIKTMNESIYYNVDYIQEAMQEDRQIRFRYYEWTMQKEKKLRKDGAWYQVSPWELTWMDENYYLIAYEGSGGRVKHYRVDKMLKMEISVEKREGRELFEDFNVGQFARRTFGMFGGDMQTVTLCCEKHFAGIMIDRFGTDISMRVQDEEHFLARVEVNVSEPFFGWIAGLGSGVRIVAPEKVAERFKEHLDLIRGGYK